MKLRELEIFVVGTPRPCWGGRYWIFTKLTTDNGIVGYGEVYAAAVGPQAMSAVIADVFERHMLGENPENVEKMFRRAYSSGFTQRPDPTVMGAFSGLEIACWDILGKARERPIYALLGGLMNERIRAYTYLFPLPHHYIRAFWGNPQQAAESAAEMVRRGFTAVKFDPAGPYTMRGGHQPSVSDIERSVEFCREIRDAVGDKADLLFGTHGQFTTAGAIRLGKRLEEFNPLWFEEPVPPDNLLEFAEVARHVHIPISTGERLTTKAEFAALLRTGGATILQPALGRAGGVLELQKIAAIAEVFNAQLAPPFYAGPVEWAANIQLAANIPNHLILETIAPDDDFHQKLIRGSITVDEGDVIPRTAPGLGIAFDEGVARANPYSAKELHLEMQDAACDYKNPKQFLGGAPPSD